MTPRPTPAYAPGVRIRPMTLDDCAAVGEIRVRGWQRAYAGMIPQAYLDAMDSGRDAERRRAYLTGRALLTEVTARARADGFGAMALWVLKENARGRRFYERAGFRPDGTEEAFEAGGAMIPELRYVRPLIPPPAG